MEAAIWSAIAILAGAIIAMLVYLGSRIDGLSARVDGVCARMDALNERIDRVLDTLVNHEGRIAALEAHPRR